MKIKSLLLPFYFGSLEEPKRLLVERELLSDPEILLDYLELKRQIEAAPAIPQGPTPALWAKLQFNLIPQRRKTLFSVSVGAALAAGVVAFILFKSRPVEQPRPANTEILFDVRSELPASSGVL